MGELSPYWKHFQKYVKRTEKKKKSKGFFLILHYFCLLKYNICIITLDCFQSSGNVKFCNPEDPTIHLLSVMNIP